MSDPGPGIKLALQLTQHDQSLEVRATTTGGEARAETQAPSGSLLEDIANLDPTGIPVSTLGSIGKALYRCLMVGDVDRLAAAIFQEGTKSNQPVLLELRFDHDQVALTQFPWEMLTNDMGQFLVRDGLIDVTRYITYPQSPPQFDTTIRGIPLLRIVAEPPTLPPITTLDLALDKIQTLPHATFEQFTRKLLIERVPLWGLQFDGHGALVLQCMDCNVVNSLSAKHCHRCGSSLEQAKQVGALAFERNGDVDWVITEEFGSILYNAHVKLALLLACESARTGGRLVFNGVAPGLLLAGVPAVVGMQYPVLDDFANNFANSFYAILLRSYDVLDALRTARRMNIRGAWYSPVMYLRHQLSAKEPISESAYHMRSVDTAVPSKTQVGADFLVRLWIRRPETKPLSVQALRNELDVPESVSISQRQVDANLKFEPVEQAEGRKLRRGEVQVTLESSADCDIRSPQIRLFVDENLDAPPAIFAVRAKATGKAPLIFRLSQDGAIIASVTHHVQVVKQLRTQDTSIETESRVVAVQDERDTVAPGSQEARPVISEERRYHEKIRVLIVDDSESTREGTQRLLEYEDNIEIVGFAENGLIAIERAKEFQPDVVLMDINMPVMNGIDATQRLQQEAPRTKVIVVSVQDDARYLKQAFRAGAVDFVAKPITSAELAQAIERAYNSIQAEPALQPMPVASQAWPGAQWPAPPSSEGHVISVLGLKGGVGKTTLAVNLGVGLARANKRTVVVDTNLISGDVSVFLNTRGQHTIVDLAHMASDPEQLESQAVQSVLITHETGVKLLAAPKDPRESEPVSSEALVNLLNYLKREFDYVIVDTSTTLDGVVDASIQAAERLIVVTTPTMPALKDAQILLSLLDAESLEKVVLVLNMVDKYSRITADQITNYLKRPVAVQIPTDPSAIEAVNQGIALITLDPRRAPSIYPLLSLVQQIRDTFEVEGEETSQQEVSRKKWW